jgi:cytoskeletal protein RodZ
MRIDMKIISIIGLISVFVLSAWAQETNKPGRVQQKNQGQIQSTAQTSNQSKMVKKETSAPNNNQENAIDYQQAGKSPMKIRGTQVQNTVSGDKKVRVSFGSAYDSGPRQKMEKKNEPSPCSRVELKKALPAAKKMELVRTTHQDE